MTRLLRLWRLSARDFGLLWFVLKHPQRPAWAIPGAAALVLYAIEPLNLALPVFGLIDEFVVVPLALHLLLKCVPAAILSDYAAHLALKRR